MYIYSDDRLYKYKFIVSYVKMNVDVDVDDKCMGSVY